MAPKRLSFKDKRPDATSPCFNAKDGCEGRVGIGISGLCRNCQAGKPLPSRAGLASLLKDVEAINKLKADPKRSNAAARLAHFNEQQRARAAFAPGALDKAAQATLDRVYFREVFAEVVREFCACEPKITLAELCAVGLVSTYHARYQLEGRRELTLEMCHYLAEAMEQLSRD